MAAGLKALRDHGIDPMLFEPNRLRGGPHFRVCLKYLKSGGA